MFVPPGDQSSLYYILVTVILGDEKITRSMIKKLNGCYLDDKTLTVELAKEGVSVDEERRKRGEHRHPKKDHSGRRCSNKSPREERGLKESSGYSPHSSKGKPQAKPAVVIAHGSYSKTVETNTQSLPIAGPTRTGKVWPNANGRGFDSCCTPYTY